MSHQKRINYFHKQEYLLLARHKPLLRTVGDFETSFVLKGKLKTKIIFRMGDGASKLRKFYEKQKRPTEVTPLWIFSTLKSY